MDIRRSAGWRGRCCSRSLPPDEARRIIEALEHQVYEQPFSFLQKDRNRKPARRSCQSEHPQTIALVLSHLPSTMASEILLGLETQRVRSRS